MQTVCPGPVESNIFDYAFTKDVNKVRIKNTILLTCFLNKTLCLLDPFKCPFIFLHSKCKEACRNNSAISVGWGLDKSEMTQVEFG